LTFSALAIGCSDQLHLPFPDLYVCFLINLFEKNPFLVIGKRLMFYLSSKRTTLLYLAITDLCPS
jgi:hypothetical protein